MNPNNIPYQLNTASILSLLLARAVEHECEQAISDSTRAPTREHLALLLTALQVSRRLAERAPKAAPAVKRSSRTERRPIVRMIHASLVGC